MSCQAEVLQTFFEERFGRGGDLVLSSAPGRVNLIGDHTDYNGLPVFPMALQHRMNVLFRARPDQHVRLASTEGYAEREFRITRQIEPYPAGDWGNYLKAAACALAGRYGDLRGMDAVVCGDIPIAAGLSSSSALVVSAALALLSANQITATFDELMELLPEGEQYVGTRGGAMDHAVSLAGESGNALHIDFLPLRIHPTSVPAEWRFLVAHSLVRAEKSAGQKQQYNARRESCSAALAKFSPGLSYQELLKRYSREELLDVARRMPLEEGRRFRHVVTEGLRVNQAREAMLAADMQRFGELMSASHASLRDDFEVSHPEVDRLVEELCAAGAAGARVTGAGFGGCAVALCSSASVAQVAQGVEAAFYAARPQRTAFGDYLFQALPSAGAQVTQLR